MARAITEAERAYAEELLAKARRAMCLIEGYDQAKVDRLCQAVAWAIANEKTGLSSGEGGDPLSP